MQRAITHQNVQSTVGDIIPSDESDDEGWSLLLTDGVERRIFLNQSQSQRELEW